MSQWKKEMKTIDYYNSLSYKLEIIEDKDEGGYVASYPDLPGCISCGQTIESAIKNVQDAKTAWLNEAIENKLDVPEPNDESKYSGQFKLRIPKTLHKLLAEQAKKEGTSMNQYCMYLLSKNF